MLVMVVIETEMVTEMENPIKKFDPLEQAQWKIKPSQLVIGKRIGAGGCVSSLLSLVFIVKCLAPIMVPLEHNTLPVSSC